MALLLFLYYYLFMAGNLTIKISSFKNGDFIPPKYTCDSDNINPMIEFLNIPENTKSLLLLVDDPDASSGGVWNHWLMWNIEPKTHYIPEDSIPFGAKQGVTSFNKQKYNGPCPPRGSGPHRYFFKVYALDTMLDLPEGGNKADAEKAMAGHIIEQAEFMGLYSRKESPVNTKSEL